MVAEVKSVQEKPSLRDAWRLEILHTVHYYDLLDFPLTIDELWYAMGSDQEVSAARPTFQEFSTLLAGDTQLEQRDDYVFIAGREELINRRESVYPVKARLWGRLKWVVAIMRWMPFVRMIALSGSLALDNSKMNSDIDLFIVGRQGRLWTTRIFTKLLAICLGLHRWDSKVSGRFCLNHYVSDSALRLDQCNLYTARLFSQLIPVYGFACYRTFQKENLWVRQFLPRYPWYRFPPFPVMADGGLMSKVKAFEEGLLGGRVGDWVEATMAAWQRHHIEQDPRRLSPEAQVVTSEEMLRFHLQAQEPVVLSSFRQRIAALSL